MKASIRITLEKDNGTTVSRTIDVSSDTYPKRESQAKFKARVRRQAASALNSVLGTPDGLKVTDASV